ncbi:MerC domain-containing protein [Pseudomaricurvus alkylphenolicus]|uniref:MerC domain-containing protein n=1 Tax=Pseudomaricurvus alkylphenolicus TaxID=1306991 RepID=UPI0030B8A953
MKPSYTTSIDKAAIGLSLLCAAHCLLLPVAMVMLPALASTIFGEERFHFYLLIAVIPASLFALTMGCRQHRNTTVLKVGLPGIAVLVLVSLFGHDLLGEQGEKLGTVFGTALVALGHVFNYRLCNQKPCSCD